MERGVVFPEVSHGAVYTAVRWSGRPQQGQRYGAGTLAHQAGGWKQGGAGVWHPPTIDADLGLVYVATGNAVPMFGGMARKGDNLYTASILALDMKTGKLRRPYQVVQRCTTTSGTQTSRSRTSSTTRRSMGNRGKGSPRRARTGSCSCSIARPVSPS